MGIAAKASLLSSEILNDVQKQALVDACKEFRIGDAADILLKTPNFTEPHDYTVTAHKYVMLHNLRECSRMLMSEAYLVLMEAWTLTKGEIAVSYPILKSASDIETAENAALAVKRLTSLEKRSKNRAKLLCDAGFPHLDEILALVSQAKAILAPLI